jgi:ABC-2 type transport system ATP-binding protein
MEQVFGQCVAEAKARGASILLSSHILSEVEQLCDRISIIRQGRIIDSGTLTELRHLTRNKLSVEARRPLAGLEALAGVYNVMPVGAAGSAAEHVAEGAAESYAVQFDLDTSQTSAVLGFLAGKGVTHLTSTPPTLEELFMRHYASETKETKGERPLLS